MMNSANMLTTIPQQKQPGFLALICLVASLGGLLFGFDTAVISGTVSQVEALFNLSKLQVGWFTSSALLGCILGAMVAGTLGDRFGRKPVLLAAALFFFLSALGSAIPPTFEFLIAARILGGIGVGAASVLAPMLISEFSPARIRGRLVALYQLSIVIGILFAYGSNWLLLRFADARTAVSFVDSIWQKIMVDEVWRAMFGTEMIPAALFFFLLLLIPESPRWLIQAGRREQGLNILARISGYEPALQQTAEIETAVHKEPGKLAELLQPGLRRALLVGVALSFFGQLTGINVVIYYGPTILQETGLQIGSALQYQVALGAINLVFTVIALLLIDRLGRRPLLLGGMAAVVVMLALAGVLFAIPGIPPLLIVIVLAADVACLALSICAVIWVLTPEIFPNRIRGRAMSIATLTNWSTNAISAYLFPWYVMQFGMHTGFFTFAAICLLATLLFWRWVPETRGKSLEEIEQFWQNTA